MADFYKYEGNDTVYNQQNQALDYNTYISQGGAKDFSNVSTVQGQPAPTLLTSSQLTPAPQLDIPTQQSNITNASSSVEGTSTATKTYNDYLAQFNQQSPEQKQYDTLVQSFITGLEGTKGQTQALAEEEQKAGVPDLQKQLSQLNADILSGVAEFEVAKADYEKQIQAVEGKVATMGALRGEQARIARQQAADLKFRASEIALNEARALGTQGRVEAAQKAAKRAVDLRYAPKLEELDILSRQIEALQKSGILDRQETLQAEARAAAYQSQREQIAEEKAKAKTNLDLALSLGINTQFVNRNGEFFNARTGQAYSSPEQFFKDAGVSSFDEAYSRGLVSNIDNSTILEKGQVGQLIAKYWDVGITMADTLETARQKAQRSRIFQKETHIASNGTIPTSWTSTASNMDAEIKNIIAQNPGEWGKAADAIDTQFGKGTATLYDSWLKAAYQNGKSVEQLGASPISMDGITKTILASGKLTNQQRADVIGYIQASGLPGAQQWWVNNKFSTNDKQDYNLYSNSAGILAGVLPLLESTNEMGVGPYKALWESKKPYLLMQQDEQYTQLYQMIETAQAQIRKGFYGTAVTGTEQGNAQRFLINPEDSYNAIVAKVKGLMGVLSFVNDANTLRPFGIKVNFEDYVPLDIPTTASSSSNDGSGFWNGVVKLFTGGG